MAELRPLHLNYRIDWLMCDRFSNHLGLGPQDRPIVIDGHIAWAAYWEGIAMHALCRLYLYEGLRLAEGCQLYWREPTVAEDPEGLSTGTVDLEEG